MSISDNVYDIAIIGAGPTGATAALSLRDSGLKTILIDAESFPRDKVCGDALGGHIPGILKELSPEYLDGFHHFAAKTTIQHCKLAGPNMKFTKVNFSRNGFVSKREDFDQYLFNIAQKDSGAEIRTNFKVKSIERKEDGFVLKGNDGMINAKFLIGADGAHSVVAKQLGNFKVEPDHYCGAVRAYYENIENLPDDTLEVYFLEGFLPGYFWIFPLPDNKANVGFGMLSSAISEQRVNLNQSIPAILESFPELGKRFQNARLLGKITGFGLPLGSKKRSISGDGFILCGDAASLIDPFSGEGIGNGMRSAMIGARVIKEAFSANDFSQQFLTKYDQQVYEKLWPTFRTSHFFQRLLGSRSWLINLLIASANKNRFVKKWLHEAL